MMIARADSAIVTQAVRLAHLRAAVAENEGAWYALLDACDDPKVWAKTHELGDRCSCLYRGRAALDYAAVAPYLTSLTLDLFDWIVAELADRPWGALVNGSTDLPTLRKHFRRFLTVRDPDSNRLFFRFYDPRILPAFLKTCHPDEASRFFGPVERFAMITSPDAALHLELAHRTDVNGQFVLRPEQMCAMEELALQHAHQSLVEHVREFFPQTMEVLGDVQVRRLVEFVYELAARRGLTAEREVCMYLNLCLFLGSRFEDDVQYEWAGLMLDDTSVIDPAERLELAHDAAIEYMDRIAGSRNQFLQRALRALAETPLPQVESWSPTVAWEVTTWLRTIWPQKAFRTGVPALTQLVQFAVNTARSHGLAEPRAYFLLAAMMFMLGAGVVDDPQFPEVQTLLTGDSPWDAKIERLSQLALDYVRRAVDQA